MPAQCPPYKVITQRVTNQRQADKQWCYLAERGLQRPSRTTCRSKQKQLPLPHSALHLVDKPSSWFPYKSLTRQYFSTLAENRRSKIEQWAVSVDTCPSVTSRVLKITEPRSVGDQLTVAKLAYWQLRSCLHRTAFSSHSSLSILHKHSVENELFWGFLSL